MSLDVEALLAPVSGRSRPDPSLSYDLISGAFPASSTPLERRRRRSDVGPAAGPRRASRPLGPRIASHGFCFALISGDLTRCAPGWRSWPASPGASGDLSPGFRRRARTRPAAAASLQPDLQHRPLGEASRPALALPPLCADKGTDRLQDIVSGADPAQRLAQLLQMPEPIRRAIDDIAPSRLAGARRYAGARWRRPRPGSPGLRQRHCSGAGRTSPPSTSLWRACQVAQAVVTNKSPQAAAAGDGGAAAPESGGGFPVLDRR